MSKKKKKGASTVDRKEERLSDERKKVPLDDMNVTPQVFSQSC
jgi:hypothetical protein